jgi:hypothetical protein
VTIQRALLPTLLTLALTAHCMAQQLPVLGQGNITCDSWLERRQGDQPERAAATAWLLGYITAFNQYQAAPRRDVSGGKSTEDLTAWIDGYCRENPSNDLYRASIALVQALLKNAK